MCSLGSLTDRRLSPTPPPPQLLCSPLSIVAGWQMKLSISLMTFYGPIGNQTYIHVLHATLYRRWLWDLYIQAPLMVHSISTSPDRAHTAASYITQVFIMDAILTAVREGEGGLETGQQAWEEGGKKRKGKEMDGRIEDKMKCKKKIWGKQRTGSERKHIHGDKRRSRDKTEFKRSPICNWEPWEAQLWTTAN